MTWLQIVVGGAAVLVALAVGLLVAERKPRPVPRPPLRVAKHLSDETAEIHPDLIAKHRAR